MKQGGFTLFMVNWSQLRDIYDRPPPSRRLRRNVIAFDVIWYALLLIVSLVSQRVRSRSLRTT